MDFEQREILSVLSNVQKPLMIKEIAAICSLNRHTVARKLDTLELLGRVRKIEIGNAKKYYITKAISVSSLIDISSDLILVLNEGWEVQYINIAAQKHLEVSDQIITGKRLDLLHLEIFSTPEVVCILKEFSFQKVSKIILPVTKKGSEYWYEISIMNISLRPGSIFIAVIASNITEKFLNERTIIENEAIYRSLFEYAPIPINEADFSQVKNYLDEIKKSGVEDLNSYFNDNPEVVKTCICLIRVRKTNKQSKDGLWDKTIDQTKILEYLLPYFSPDTLHNYKEMILALYNGSDFFQFTTTTINPKGKIKYFSNYLSVASPFHDISRVYVSYLDVTEQKNDHLHVLRTNKDLISVNEEIIAHDTEIQKEIKELVLGRNEAEKLNVLFGQLLNATNLPMIMWNSSMTIVWMSQALNEFCGCFNSNLIGKNLESLFPEDLKIKQNLLNSLCSRESNNGLVISLLHQSGCVIKVNWGFVEKIVTSHGIEIYAAIIREVQ
jgi:PAS domain-containing protein